jgi:NAD(P)-dependent dehydrogenase (short-subunit alcohol dehydrogenase family)
LSSGRAVAVIDLSDRLAVVTGAASGIGRATAEALSRAGARIVVADIDDANASLTAADIRAAGGVAESISVDVPDRPSVERLRATVHEAFGAVRLLVNGVGWDRSAPFIDTALSRT